MKKLAYVAILAIFVMGFIACGGASDDPKVVMEDFTKVMENFANQIESASSAGDVAAALDSYADEMERLIPQFKAVQEKHPELMNQQDMPEEYEELNERMIAAQTKLNQGGLMQKMQQYASDEAVMKSLQRFSEVMMKMMK